MKIADYISKSIQEYPFLYKDIDFEKSKLKVLNHIFFVYGNGLDFALTEKINEGGYIVKPKFKKDKQTGEFIRVYDKPYGKVKYSKIPNGYFESVVYYVYAGERPLQVLHKKIKHYEDSVYFRYNNFEGNHHNKPKLYIAENKHEFYPNVFSENNCIASDIFNKKLFLQDDWVKEFIDFCKKCLEYYNDFNKYKNHYRYKNSDFDLWEKLRKNQIKLLTLFIENLQ